MKQYFLTSEGNVLCLNSEFILPYYLSPKGRYLSMALPEEGESLGKSLPEITFKKEFELENPTLWEVIFKTEDGRKDHESYKIEKHKNF